MKQRYLLFLFHARTRRDALHYRFNFDRLALFLFLLLHLEYLFALTAVTIALDAITHQVISIQQLVD